MLCWAKVSHHQSLPPMVWRCPTCMTRLGMMNPAARSKGLRIAHPSDLRWHVQVGNTAVRVCVGCVHAAIFTQAICNRQAKMQEQDKLYNKIAI